MSQVSETAVSYFFSNGNADGSAAMVDTLGSKGAHLSEMCNMGIAVPPGFVLSTSLCKKYYNNGKCLPPELPNELRRMLKKIEKFTGKNFGGETNPLLLSVRSGAVHSMPGMMDTVLNVGITSKSLPGLLKVYPGNSRFVYDSYRRLIHMYGVVVSGISDCCFEEVLSDMKVMNGIKSDSDFTGEDLHNLVLVYKEVFKRETKRSFPDDAFEQLLETAKAVFDSWTSTRAVKYREMNCIPHDSGTAVTIQSMVFGNLNAASASGVIFSRNPSTGEDGCFGEYLTNAQGEDIVAGIRTPLPTSGSAESLEVTMPNLYIALKDTVKSLERHYGYMQDVEFTISDGVLWILQTRRGKRSTRAGIKIAMDMYKEGLISKENAVLSVDPEELDNLFYPMLDSSHCSDPVLIGMPASPGSASGMVVFDSEDAEKMKSEGCDVILFRTETSPEDIRGMYAAGAIVTARGGMTSHAAVVARGMGRACICGAADLTINNAEKTAEVKHNGIARKVVAGDIVTVNGNTGEVFLGKIPLVAPILPSEFYDFMNLCMTISTMKFRANADTTHDAAVAKRFFASGIGLCRTEHMFFDEHKLAIMRRAILIQDQNSIDDLLAVQREDIKEMLSSMDGHPVTVRLLDPPLHEFFSNDPIALKNIGKAIGMDEQEAITAVAALHEANPMLGLRGVRLGIVTPAIYRMQITAILEAAASLEAEGKRVIPEIMVPFVFCEHEIIYLKQMVSDIALQVATSHGSEIEYRFGAMIELPRAALIADTLAKHVDFFSFGTNDLTQTVLGISRDDSAKFITHYMERGFLTKDPFRHIDEDGVGKLMTLAVEKIRNVNPDVKIGICGEHGAEPENAKFFRRLGIDYVSCSPYSIPRACLAMAKSVVLSQQK